MKSLNGRTELTPLDVDHLVSKRLDSSARLPLLLTVLDEKHRQPREGAVPPRDELAGIRVGTLHLYPEWAGVAYRLHLLMPKRTDLVGVAMRYLHLSSPLL